jgi:hypothetical protein
MPKKISDASEQHARFLETARALGCDEDEAAFTEKLKVIASHKPAPKPAVNKPPKKPRSEV